MFFYTITSFYLREFAKLLYEKVGTWWKINLCALTSSKTNWLVKDMHILHCEVGVWQDNIDGMHCFCFHKRFFKVVIV